MPTFRLLLPAALACVLGLSTAQASSGGSTGGGSSGGSSAGSAGRSTGGGLGGSGAARSGTAVPDASGRSPATTPGQVGTPNAVSPGTGTTLGTGSTSVPGGSPPIGASGNSAGSAATDPALDAAGSRVDTNAQSRSLNPGSTSAGERETVTGSGGTTTGSYLDMPRGNQDPNACENRAQASANILSLVDRITAGIVSGRVRADSASGSMQQLMGASQMLNKNDVGGACRVVVSVRRRYGSAN